jgi:hypothetical protein
MAYKVKSTISFLYNSLNILISNQLFCKYNFFIVYDALICRQGLIKKNFSIRTQFFLKRVIKNFLFSFFFDKKRLKHPLLIQFINRLIFFQKTIMNFLKKNISFLYLRCYNFVFSCYVFIDYYLFYPNSKDLDNWAIFYLDRVLIF